MVFTASLLAVFRGWTQGLDNQMIPGHSLLLPTAASGDWLNAVEKFHILWDCDYHWDFNFKQYWYRL